MADVLAVGWMMCTDISNVLAVGLMPSFVLAVVWMMCTDISNVTAVGKMLKTNISITLADG